MDKFINDGTTTEYMTRHVGTYIDNAYAKIESTNTREYYRVDFSPPPVASSGLEIDSSEAMSKQLVASSTSYEVNGRQTTQHTVHHFRTRVDGHYAHLVSSESKVFSDPPIVSATPVYQPYGARPAGGRKEEYKFPREQISPSRPSGEDENIVTRTIGAKVGNSGDFFLFEPFFELTSVSLRVCTDMQEKVKARLRELAPPRPERAKKRDSRNLAFSCISVLYKNLLGAPFKSY